MKWVVAILCLALLAVAVVAVAAPWFAQRALDTGIAEVEREVEAATGGEASVVLATSPVESLLRLRRDELPSGRVVVTDGRLPDGGVRFRRGELVVAEVDEPGRLTLWIPPDAITEQVDVQGLEVTVDGQRLRLGLGLLSVGVRARVVDGRVALDVPSLPPPFGQFVDSGLTDLVPPPPDGVTLTDVRVLDGEVVVRADVDLAVAAAAVREQGYL